jgi:1-acyl-sn-glycerol-3-phosphate acyltransferase
MGKMLAVLRAILMALTMVVFMLCYSVTLLFRKHTPKSAFNLRRAWVVIGHPIMGAKIDITGTPSKEPAIYMSNHRSFTDPLFQAKAFDAFIIAKAEVANIPVMSQAATLTGIIYVQRESKSSRKATIIKLIETVKEGYNVLIYPEGTTGDLVTTKPFKLGAFKAAASNGFPIVPVAIDYKKLKDHWQGRSLFSHFLIQFGKLKSQAKISLGPPLRSDDPEELMNKTKDWIDAELLRLQKDWQEPR